MQQEIAWLNAVKFKKIMYLYDYKLCSFCQINYVLSVLFCHTKGTEHIIKVFHGFHHYYARALKCLGQGDSHEGLSGTSEVRTRDLQVTRPTLYHWALQKPFHMERS